MMKTITLNGKQAETEAQTIDALVVQLDMDGQKIAVECNLEIVPRSAWGEQVIRDGDKIEIIQFVGGGK